MSNIEYVCKAIKNLGYYYDYIGSSEHAIIYMSPSGKQYFFKASSNPVNLDTLSKIFTNKGHTYEILKNHVQLPDTRIYNDPINDTKYHNIGEIVDDISKNVVFPCIIKRGKGMRGSHVYKCDRIEEAEIAINSIFSPGINYDDLILVQRYIQIQREYRVIIYKNKVILVYYKNIEEAIFQGNISPMYHEGAVTIPVSDKKILEDIQKYVDTITPHIQLPYTGMDLAFDIYGKYYMIELNTSPSLAKYVRDNGEEKVVNMFATMLQDLE